MPARLHHERIAHGDASPARWLLATHGIFGAGSNWRGIARKLVARRPDWGVVLVDLRQHGRSEPGEPPHTVAACADDVRALVESVEVHALLGHSFGGKVMLAARSLVAVAQTWLLDSSPVARPELVDNPANSVEGVLSLLERLPRTWDKREDFVAAVTADGHDAGLAQWLALNIVPDANGTLVNRLDPRALRELLADYFRLDLWNALVDPARGDVELVLASRSETVDAETRTRLAGAPPHVHVHHVDAGHWLHIDAPDTVVALIANRLPA